MLPSIKGNMNTTKSKYRYGRLFNRQSYGKTVYGNTRSRLNALCHLNGRFLWDARSCTPLFPSRVLGVNKFYGQRVKMSGLVLPQFNRQRFMRLKATTDPLMPLGFDFLTFLASTVVVIPICKKVNVPPVLGFLFSGLVLQQLGLLRDKEDIERLSELGVLFLLFEMGLELSIDRLKALAKYAFGMGSLQVLLSAALFTAVALPVGQGLATRFLEAVVSAPPGLVSIRSLDEAVVIGVALSMSSSAFVLQLLSERGELTTRFGSATLGILLFQDIAVVPFLILLPLSKLVEGDASAASLLQLLGPTAAKTVAGLAALLFSGRFVLRRIFEVVAASRSPETFVAMSLLTVTGASVITNYLGFSDTFGAFIAGVLVSETSFRTQVEATIAPFRGLLLGLFFVSTGASINMQVLLRDWPSAAWILFGLLFCKTAIVTSLGPGFGLSKAESVRVGFILSQGGEFAFVLLSLANALNILPTNLNELLIIVVVMSMALTPALAEAGKVAAEFVEGLEQKGEGAEKMPKVEPINNLMEDPVVICGFGLKGQMLANMLENPLATTSGRHLDYIAFDLEPKRVESARAAGFPVMYGDATPDILKAAGVEKPRAFVVNYPRKHALKAVKELRNAFPSVPIFTAGLDFKHAAELRAAGADSVTLPSANAGLAMGTELLLQVGTPGDDVQFLKKGIEDALTVRGNELLRDDTRGSDQVLLVRRSEHAHPHANSVGVKVLVLDPLKGHQKISAKPSADVTEA